ncbi:MAG: hypothetical protein DRI61_12235 [Chloroflexi bacterium]|nr:MAG: hypothetical protein DRI61_12235 [Chloroflexota bacterium]
MMEKRMKCIAPGVIKEWEIEAYLDGIPNPRVSAHLAECPACAAEVRALLALRQALSEKLYRFDCPSVDELRDFIWGHTSKEKKRDIVKHIRLCSLCRAEAIALHRAKLEEEAYGRVPLLELIRTWLQRIAEDVQLVVMQTLAPPSWQPALRGRECHVRLYQVRPSDRPVELPESLSLFLTWKRQDNGDYTLGGRLLPSEAAGHFRGSEVVLFDERGSERAYERIGADGTFTFTGIPPGHYALAIMGEKEALVTAEVEVKE